MSLESQRGSLSETHLTDGAEIRPSTATPGNRAHLKQSAREARQSLGHQAGSAAVRGEDFSTTVAFDCTLHKEPPLDRLNYGPRRGRIKVMQIKEERCGEGGETVRQKILHWQRGEADKAASWRR